MVIEPHFCHLTQLALVPEIGAAGVLVATDSALLAGYKNLASLERTTSLNMEHMQVNIISCCIASDASYERSGKIANEEAMGLVGKPVRAKHCSIVVNWMPPRRPTPWLPF